MSEFPAPQEHQAEGVAEFERLCVYCERRPVSLMDHGSHCDECMAELFGDLS